jgi:uncharacterized protein Yka (UPF0111/DUF47 family)
MRFGPVASKVLNNPLTSKVSGGSAPFVPNFYALLNEQCMLCVEVMGVLAQFMVSNDPEKGLLVRELEKRGDEIKMRNMVVLTQAFATPMDREDIYRAVISIDQIINYAKTTVREMEILQLVADPYSLEMTQLLSGGVEALQQGYQKLASDPSGVEDDAEVVRKAERNIEKAYRRAIAQLFQVEEGFRTPEGNAPGLVMDRVVEMFKRRELYRHLSNAGDRLVKAADVMHDIAVQLA